jgi:(S)-citramalyl-CoA lyase
MRRFRTLLFLPSTRLDRFERALSAKADTVCIDLEDAVAPANKADARSAVAAHLRGLQHVGQIGVRINGLGTPWWRDDLDVVADVAAYVLVPKIGSPQDLTRLSDRLSTPLPLMALVESPEGPSDRGRSPPPLASRTSSSALSTTRPRLAARWIGTICSSPAASSSPLAPAPMSSFWTPPQEIFETSRRFTRPLCRPAGWILPVPPVFIPDQVSCVRAVFTPSAVETEHARRVLEAFEAASGGVAQLDGKLIELPLARVARRILNQAEA